MDKGFLGGEGGATIWNSKIIVKTTKEGALQKYRANTAEKVWQLPLHGPDSWMQWRLC